jgi:hypothetical protein
LELRFSIGSSAFTHNGVTRYADAPIFIDSAYGRTMVPIRVIAESMGASVIWSDVNRTIDIVTDEATLHLYLDIPLPGGMGIPVIVHGRTFVPLAFVSEMLGANVRWDAQNRAVYVNQNATSAPEETPPWQAPGSTPQPTPRTTATPRPTATPTPTQPKTSWLIPPLPRCR